MKDCLHGRKWGFGENTKDRLEYNIPGDILELKSAEPGRNTDRRSPNSDPDGDMKSAFKRFEIVSTRLIPGDAEIATIFDFCAFEETTGTVLEPSSVLGTCAFAGKASSTRWRCRVKTIVRKDLLPSSNNMDLRLGESWASVDENEGEKGRPAAAA